MLNFEENNKELLKTAQLNMWALCETLKNKTAWLECGYCDSVTKDPSFTIYPCSPNEYFWECSACSHSNKKVLILNKNDNPPFLRTKTKKIRMFEKDDISKSLRFKVLNRDNFTCQYCGRKPPEVKLHVDHIVPSSKNGYTRIDNLITACQECNLGKSDKELGKGDI